MGKIRFPTSEKKMHYTVSVERSDLVGLRRWNCYKPLDTEEDHKCKDLNEVLIDAYRQVHSLGIDGKFDEDYFGAFVSDVFKGAERDKKQFGKQNLGEFGAHGMECRAFTIGANATTRISVAVWIRK
ncbi:hypothetical protein CPT_Marzo_191 [Stenotrophomonas phage Marzo]|nr:hypothetical protein CPT_Marzo_191 [Stenotrophomonas phage Marzo]